MNWSGWKVLAAILLAVGIVMLFTWPGALASPFFLMLGGTEFLPVRWD